MDKFLQLVLTFFLVFTFQSTFAQTYVDQAATGSNDGTSWANAYTSLDDAIANTTSGDIWIAAGTYRPSGGDKEASFILSNSVNLYGGFSGTETTIDDRNLLTNITILDGDHMNNDMFGNFDSILKADNSLHVIFIDSLLGNITIDGFTISGGSTEDNADLELEMVAGGGVFTYSPVTMKNISFQDNFARAGAGIYIDGAATPIIDCSFESIRVTRSYSTSQSAGIFAGNVTNLDITGSEFFENITSRGALYPLRCNGVNITNCSFSLNESTGFGGALFLWNNNDVLIENSEFMNNEAGSGAVMYIDGREAIEDVDNVIIRNCSFTDNTAISGFGGALNCWESSITVENSEFINNEALAGSGGAVSNGGNSGDGGEMLFKGNSFSDNFGSFGGAMTVYCTNANFVLEDNEFISNEALTSGGSLICGFNANAIITNNTFDQGQGRFGGAIAVQNNGAIDIIDNDFTSNSTTDNAGAINVLYGAKVLIEDCNFELNSTIEFGGVISANLAADSIPGLLEISRSVFTNNGTENQGGVLNLSDFNSNISNSIFAFNNNVGDGYGGAISANASGGYTSEVNIINSTFNENFAINGAGISAFTDDIPETSLTVNIGNTILYNPDGDNYAIEAGNPNIVSLGGNLSSDSSTDGFLTATNDISDGPNPEFKDPDILNFYLKDYSPAIDIGIVGIAPDEDINGVERVNEPDAGAVEFDPETFIKETVVNDQGKLDVYPNPVRDVLAFEMENNWTGTINLEIVDVSGVLYSKNKLQKSTENAQFNLDISTFETGVYFLIVKSGNEAMFSKFVKM